MSDFPETRLSLVLRLPDSNQAGFDQQAWHEFVEVYTPFLYRFACRKGLSGADAEELVQQVMVSVSRSIGRWQPRQGETSGFRNWLFTIARNHCIDWLRASERRMKTASHTTQLHALEQVAEPAVGRASGLGQSSDLEDDYRQEAFVWAAGQVKKVVAEPTWRAFQLTMLDGLSCDATATQLGISIGSVYAARSRVLQRIKEQVQLFTSMQSNGLKSRGGLEAKGSVTPRKYRDIELGESSNIELGESRELEE